MKYMRTNSFLKDFLICKDFAYLESTIEYEKEVKGWMHENGGKQSGVLCAAQNMIQLLTWQKSLMCRLGRSITMCKPCLFRIPLRLSAADTVEESRFPNGTIQTPMCIVQHNWLYS